MSFQIILDPQLAKPQKSHDFEIRFDPPIILDENKNYKIALDQVFTIPYSWYNVRAVYDNNKIKWKKKTESSWKEIVFPDGMYTYDDINSFLQKKIGDEFELFFDKTIFRTVIVLKDISVDFSLGKFAELLGFEKKVFSSSSVSKWIPNITRGVDWIFIHCDLVSREVVNVGPDVLFCLPTSMIQIGYNFSKVPRRIAWLPVNKHLIQSIRIWVTDGRNGILDLNDLDFAISVFIKEE